MTHTPGQWVVTPGLGCKDIGPEDIGCDEGVDGIAGTFGITPESEDRANAALIAAAPELLEACHKALDGMYDQCPQYETMSNDELNHPDLDCYAVEVILDIRHAISKAEGEQ